MEKNKHIFRTVSKIYLHISKAELHSLKKKKTSNLEVIIKHNLANTWVLFLLNSHLEEKLRVFCFIFKDDATNPPTVEHVSHFL